MNRYLKDYQCVAVCVGDVVPSSALSSGDGFASSCARPPISPQWGTPNSLQRPTTIDMDHPFGGGSFPALNSKRVGAPRGTTACKNLILVATWQNRQFAWVAVVSPCVGVVAVGIVVRSGSADILGAEISIQLMN